VAGSVTIQQFKAHIGLGYAPAFPFDALAFGRRKACKIMIEVFIALVCPVELAADAAHEPVFGQGIGFFFGGE